MTKSATAKTWKRTPIINGRLYSHPLLLNSKFYAGYTPTIYAAPADIGSGNGSSEANAMDLPTALSTATAGAIIGLLPGTYSGTPSGSANTPIFTTTNSGSSGNPIRIVAKFPASWNYVTPELLSDFRSNAPYNKISNPSGWTANNPVFGIVGKSFVELIGIYLNQHFAPPRPGNGSLLMSGCTDCLFNLCTIDQITVPVTSDFNAIYDVGNIRPIIKNIYVSGGANSGNNSASAITAYGSRNFQYLNIYGKNVNTLIYIKGQSSSIGSNGLIQYCKSESASKAMIEIDDVEPSSGGISVYNNLSIRDNVSVVFGNTAPTRVTDIRVEQNTFVDPLNRSIVAMGSTALTSCTVRNNVLASIGLNGSKFYNFVPAITPVTSNYNIFFKAASTAQFNQNSTDYSGLTAWQATGKDANSNEIDPGFTSAITGDYKRAGSDTGSSSGGRRGCYITNSEVIGLEIG